MKFEVKTEEEINAMRQILKQGVADFTIVGAKEKLSGNNNLMVVVTLRCWDKSGKEGTVFDYIVFNYPPKIKHFCESIDCIDMYNNREIITDGLIGKSGRCVLVVENSEKYGDKNRVEDYIKPDGTPLEKVLDKLIVPEGDAPDDDVPF